MVAAPPGLAPILSHDDLRVAKRPDDWAPNSEQQIRFLSSPAFEALFGGAAGPGKTDCLLMEAARDVWHPYYTGILFRRTFPMLEAANGLIQRSLHWYTALGGTYNGSKHIWTFPSGAMIYFAHMQLLKNMYDHQGAEYCFVGFDELTEFLREQYLYMFTRCRVPSLARTYSQEHDLPQLRARVRTATNPGNIGHPWVKGRFITRDIVNRRRYFATNADGDDVEVAQDDPDALSRAFYPARLDDNPDADPGYRARIRASGDPVRIAQLEAGDWDAEHTGDRVYDNWSSQPWPDGNVTSEAEYRPDLPLYWAIDDGYVYGHGPGYANYHPRVILFVQDNALGGLDVVDELVVTEETHDETLATVLGPADGSPPALPTRWQTYRRPSVVYIDSAAAMFRGQITGRGLQSVASTHPVSEGQKAVRQLIRDGSGERRLRVNPRCTHLIYEMGAYLRDPRGKARQGEVLALKLDDHTQDALRYIGYQRRSA